MANLEATWTPASATRYSRAGGPWDVANLDTVLSRGAGEVLVGGTRVGAEALEELIAAVAGGLLTRGAGKGRVVCWQLPNSLAAVVLTRACWRIGAIAAPILHTLGARDADAARAAVDPVAVIEIDEPNDPASIETQLGGTFVRTGSLGVPAASLAIALFTSGSTGTPKVVLHTHRALAFKALVMGEVHGLSDADTVLMPAPLAHVSGLLNGILLPGALGMRSILMGKFDPQEALAIIKSEGVTFMAGPPTFFVAMTGLGADPGGTVRVISSGGASVTPAFVRETAAAFGCQVKRTYGSTEAPTITTSRFDDDPGMAAETDGRAVGEVELRIVAEEGDVAPGEAGELWVRGPELFAGYSDPALTEEVITGADWFKTGDLATLDGEGWLRIVGRLKDVIIRGGENISASEVEAVLERHPGIRQAVAVSYPDEKLGERVCACVVLNAKARFGLEECIEWFAAEEVAKFKTPERVVVLRELPLLGSGKADRAALSELAANPPSDEPSKGGLFRRGGRPRRAGS